MEKNHKYMDEEKTCAFLKNVSKSVNMKKKPKYKVGDLLQYKGYDGKIGYLHVDVIKEVNGEYEYYQNISKGYCCFMGEDEVKCAIRKDTKKYQDYVLYLKLKKKFEK